MARRAPTVSGLIATGVLGLAMLAGAAPGFAQQTRQPRVPSAAQAEVAAEMSETGSPYVAPAPESHMTPAEPSQTFGNAPSTYGVLHLPVAVDAGVEQPYSNSWSNDFAGQPASQNHGEVLARALGSNAQN